MFSKFNLKTNDTDFIEYYSDGKILFDKSESDIQSTLDEFIKKNGVIDGTSLQKEWFPIQKKYDVFLSHSHKDERKAIELAGFLSKELNLKVFIDSCLWGFSNNLLKEIDENYCKYSNKVSFDYEKRNYSTSHVHMMLSIALNNMIDECEAIFFLNTPNSINFVDDINEKQTMSPWIYSELNSANILRIKDIREYRDNYELIKKDNENIIYNVYNESTEANLKISYNVNELIEKFTDISTEDIMNMGKLYSSELSEYYSPLDCLYIRKGLIKIAKEN